jgi:hypothetical protein
MGIAGVVASEADGVLDAWACEGGAPGRRLR